MDIKRAEMIAKDLIGYYTSGTYSFKFDNARKRFGQCRFTDKEITISEPLASVNTEERFINTVLHEIAHALTPHEHHSLAWKAKAVSIGCDGQARYSSNEVVAVSKTYVGECPGCGYQIRKHRRNVSSCRRCSGGSFNKDYVFVWQKEI